MKQKTYAAIDIGSNAFRLLIGYVEVYPENDKKSTGKAGDDKRAGKDGGGSEKSVEKGSGTHGHHFKKAAFIRVPVRLGADVFTKGKVAAEKRKKLVEAMVAFSHLFRVFGVDSYRAYATSAMREAANGDEIIREIERESGIKVKIISGKLEAETIFEAGESAGFGGKNDQRTYMFVDVGGGSTEITVYSEGRRAFSESFPLGTVRMISGAVRESEMERFKKQLHSIREKYHPDAIIGSGGNINKIHKLLSSKENKILHYDEMKKLAEKLGAMSYEQRIEHFELNEYRADVILPALEIFLTAAHATHIDNVIVPKIGLVDGIIQRLAVPR